MANDFNTTVASLFQGMDKFLTTKTVVGEPTTIGDTIILPLVDVSFGVAAGAFASEQKNNGAGGLGGKMTASAVLVIKDGQIRLVNVKNQDTVTKVLDMVPDLIDRFQKNKPAEENSEEVDSAVSDILSADE
jgi:uncharacterized spore protein YtfJ